jgi:hypothetical protein
LGFLEELRGDALDVAAMFALSLVVKSYTSFERKALFRFVYFIHKKPTIQTK